jgi:hypothetical protein
MNLHEKIFSFSVSLNNTLYVKEDVVEFLIRNVFLILIRHTYDFIVLGSSGSRAGLTCVRISDPDPDLQI